MKIKTTKRIGIDKKVLCYACGKSKDREISAIITRPNSSTATRYICNKCHYLFKHYLLRLRKAFHKK